MMASNKDYDPQKGCPFWSAESLKCRVCKGGLFIPLEEHIELYCKTPSYPQCLQYVLHAKDQLELVQTFDTQDDNRRKYRRVNVCHKITLVKLIESNEIVSHVPVTAETLDLSLGGMRLATPKPLINQSLVEFSFGDMFPQSMQTGSGEVAWCNKQIDDPGYQAGISFHNQGLVEKMGKFLGIY